MSYNAPRARTAVGLRTDSGLRRSSDVAWQKCTNIELFEVRAPSITPEEDMIVQAFQQAYLDACYRALVGQDALRSYGANEEFQIAIDARQPAKYQENQAFIREVVDRFYDDLLAVVIDVTDAEDRARFGAGDSIGPAGVRRGEPLSSESGTLSDLQGTSADFADSAVPDGGGAVTSGAAGVECHSLASSETWLHYVLPVLGRVVVRNGFFMCFWHSTIGERVGQLECRASRQVMEVNISHVHVPLCYHFRYKGRGVTAVSLIPIGDSLTDVSEQNAEVASIAQQVASAFSLLPYESIGEPDAVAVRTTLATENGTDTAPSSYRFLPRRVQAHFGRDGRYYLVSNLHWCIPWLNSRQSGDHVMQRLSCVSPRLLARKGAHLSCRAFSAEAFIVENKSAMEFMKREIESGIAQLLTDERESAVRHLLRRQKQRSARRQERRLAEYKTRVAQLNGSSTSVPVTLMATSSSSRPSTKRSAESDMIEMQTRKAPLPSASTSATRSPSRENPLTSLGPVPGQTDSASDAAPRPNTAPTNNTLGVVDGLSSNNGVNNVLSLWRDAASTLDDNVSSQSSDDGSDNDSVDSEDIFREQDRLLANVELLGAHPLEEDNTVNPFSSGSIVERFNRVGYPKSLLGALLLSIMRFPSPPYHMVREVKREIMARGLKGYILERAYDARYGVQQALSFLHTANTTTNADGDDLGSETSSVVDGTVVRPATSTAALSDPTAPVDDSPQRKRLWASEPGVESNDEATMDESCGDPLLFSARDGAGNTGGDGDSGAGRHSRLKNAFGALRSIGRTFLGRPTAPSTASVGGGAAGTAGRKTSSEAEMARVGAAAAAAAAASSTHPRGSSDRPTSSHKDTAEYGRDRSRYAPRRSPSISVVEAFAGVVNGVIDQDFGSIVERVLVAFIQYDGTDQPRHGFARVATLLSGDSDAWAESEVLNTLYLESILPYIYRKFRLEPSHVDLTTPLCGEDKLLVYQRVCDSLGVQMRDGRADACVPSVKDFRPTSKVVDRTSRAYGGNPDPSSTQFSIPIGNGATGVRYTVPHWIRTRTDWLVRRLMLNPSATRQEWDLYGAALVPFLSIQRLRCLPSTKTALEDLMSSSWRQGGRIGRKLPLPPLGILGPMLLAQVHTMSTAPQLLWHAWAKDCYAFKEKDANAVGIGLPGGPPQTHRRHGVSGATALSLSLTSQGLDQCVEARRASMRSAGDRACLVHLLRRQAATYAVLAREIARQLRDAGTESHELTSRLAQMQSRASSASVSTMHAAITLADTLLEHLGNPYSFQYRRYSAELVRYMRARRDTIISVPRFSPTTPTTPEPNSVGSSSIPARSPPSRRVSTADARGSAPAGDVATVLGLSGSGRPHSVSVVASSAAPRSPLDGSRRDGYSGSSLFSESTENSLRLATEEEMALLHMLHQIQKYCSQDMLAALDYLQRGVLLFNAAYAQQQEQLDEERASEGLHPEDLILSTHMTADVAVSEPLETAYRLLCVLDGDTGLYTVRALANVCLYYYAIGNFVDYQESLWRLRRSWNNQGPPDIRALVLAGPSDFSAVRSSLHKLRHYQDTDGETGDMTEALGAGEAPDTSGTAGTLSRQQKWVHRRKVQPIQFRHIDFED